MSCAVDWCVSMDKNWVKTESELLIGDIRHLRLETHFSSPCLQKQLTKTWLLGEAQEIECFNKWHYQTLRLLIQLRPWLEQDWENTHKQRHFLHLHRERQMMTLLSLGCPSVSVFSSMLTKATFKRWQFPSIYSIQTHNYLLQHLQFFQQPTYSRKMEPLVLGQNEDVKHQPYVRNNYLWWGRWKPKSNGKWLVHFLPRKKL